MERIKLGKEKCDHIIEMVNEMSKKPMVVISISEGPTTLASSKLGGYPYWPKGMEFPKDSYGDNLCLLAQFNLADIKDERLPDHGLLQFLISTDDELGMDTHSYKVVYHENIDPTVTEESVKELGVIDPCENPKDYVMWPMLNSYPVSFESRIEGYSWKCIESYNAMVQVLKDEYGIDNNDEYLGDILDEEDWDYFYHACPNSPNNMFGFPFFCQDDPRSYDDAMMKKYDTLLFQLDSSYIGKHPVVQFGDMGVSNFFINSKALENRDFSDVLFYWDCT